MVPRLDRSCPVVREVNPVHQELLRRLALNDEQAAELMLGTVAGSLNAPDAGSKTHALARIAALIAAESALASYQWAVDSALAVGASETEIVDVLVAVAPIVGLARLTSAAPELALALGYEVETSERI
jgi:4-carboxymuconolactone decarboxylase